MATQTVERHDCKTWVENTEFTGSTAKTQTLHTKQNPELLQQLL